MCRRTDGQTLAISGFFAYGKIIWKLHNNFLAARDRTEASKTPVVVSDMPTRTGGTDTDHTMPQPDQACNSGDHWLYMASPHVSVRTLGVGYVYRTFNSAETVKYVKLQVSVKHRPSVDI